MDCKSANLRVETYESYQTVKYHLKSQKKTGVKVWSNVGKGLLYRNMKKAWLADKQMKRKSRSDVKTKIQTKKELSDSLLKSRKDFVKRKYENLLRAKRLAKQIVKS